MKRHLRNIKNTPHNAGFTLIEVVAAVTLLGLAFSTLITAQTYYLKMYIHEKNHLQASLVAQYLMTMIEIEDTPPELGDKSGALVDKLNDVGYFGDEARANEEHAFAAWEYQESVTKLEIPIPVGKDEDQDLLRRIDLTIRWGTGKDDKFSLLYFMKTKSD